MLDTTPYASAAATTRPMRCAQLPAKKTTWRIAAGHHPIVSSGYHGHFPRDQHLRMVTIEPLMKRARSTSTSAATTTISS